jgi:hypothetical protein
VVDPLLNPEQAADLADLLAEVSAHDHLSSGYRNQAGYWASQVGPDLQPSDAWNIASLLEDVAGSPWLSRPMEQWARAWMGTIEELTQVQEVR